MYQNKVLSRILIIVLVIIVLLTPFSNFSAISQDIQSTPTDQTNEPVTKETNQTEAEPKPYNSIQALFTDNISDHPWDMNDNDLFDLLIIELTIKVVTPGEYEIGSKMLSFEGRPIMYVYKEFETDEDSIVLFLKYDGKPIFSSRFSGPYIIEFWLSNSTGETVDSIEYKTSEYPYLDFEHAPPPLQLIGRTVDRGVDRDSNELFDYLLFHFSVNVTEPGKYTILAGLFKEIIKDPEVEPFYYLITVTREIQPLEKGNTTIKLVFSGPKIYQARFNGPYFIGLWLMPTDESELRLDEESNVNRDELLLDTYKDRFRWPMAGEGDLSGDRVFKTSDYRYTQFEPPPKIAEFTKRVKEYTLDLDNDGLIDFLVLEIEVNIQEPGEYLLWARILTREDIELSELTSENLTHLRPGKYHISLKFEGIAIYHSKLEGNLKINLMIKGMPTEDFPVIDKLEYKTLEKYHYEKFESKPDEDDPDAIDSDKRPYARLDAEGVFTKTDVMEVYTPRTRPEITFWFADTEDSGARFKLLFQRLIGYNDPNRNGQYDFGEEHFVVYLEDSHWEIQDLVYSVNSEYGNYVEFRLYSEILTGKVVEPLKTRQVNEKELDPNYNRLDYSDRWASIEFKFLVAKNDFQNTYPFTYDINGDTELKIDINIKIHKPVDVDGICIEQFLFDEERTLGFKTREKDGDNVYLPEELKDKKQKEDIELRNFEIRSSEEKQWVLFVDKAGKEYGFYSWVPKVNVTYYDGQSELMDISSSYHTDGTGFRLFTNYPYSKDIIYIEHDPSVGMVEENRPPRQKTDSNGIVDILFEPIVFIPAILIACVIVLFVFLSSRSQNNEEYQYQRNSKEPSQIQKGRAQINRGRVDGKKSHWRDYKR